MLQTLKIASLISISLYVAGCGEKGAEDETSGPTTEASSSSGEPSSGGTQVDPTSGGTDTSGETDATETGTETTETDATETDAETEPAATETETETETDSDPTGEPPPAECGISDSSATAEFSVVPIDWMDQFEDSHDFEVMCTIDAMPIEGDTIVHALTCDDAGTPRAVSLRVPLPIEGSVTWAEGDTVRLEARREEEIDFGIDYRRVRMFAADETPLLLGHAGASELGPHLDPIEYEAEFPCGPEDEESGKTGQRIAVRFTFAGQSVTIVGGHRDVLPTDGGAVFAIDLPTATTNHCCHYTRKYSVLIRRIMPL